MNKPVVWPKRSLVMECLKLNLMNTFVGHPVAYYFLYPVFKRFGMPTDAPLPSLWTFIWQPCVFFLINDLGFFAVHYAVHANRWLYQNIHKKHHRVRITIVSRIAHENVCLNLQSLPPSLLIISNFGDVHVILKWIRNLLTFLSFVFLAQPLAATYAHPIEEIFANGLPTLLGPMLMDCHMAVFWFYFFIRLVSACQVTCVFSRCCCCCCC